MKCLFQTLCIANLDWDVELSGKSLSIWNSLSRDINAIKAIHAPRCYNTRSSPISKHQIHGFSDASEKAYGAVGTVEVNLVDKSSAAKTANDS